MAKKTYDDDDGRTIVDMSGVERPPMFGAMFRTLPSKRDEKTPQKEKKGKESGFTKKEQRWYIFGALGGALLIGLVFVVAFALLIILLLTIWHAW